MADAVNEVLVIHSDQIGPPPRLGTRLKTEFITGMGKVCDQFMILLSIDRIFNIDELELVQDMRNCGEEETEDALAEA